MGVTEQDGLFFILFNVRPVFFLKLSAGIAKFSKSSPSNKTQKNICKAVLHHCHPWKNLLKAEFAMERD